MKTLKYILSVLFILLGLSVTSEKLLLPSIPILILGFIIFPNISEKLKALFTQWNSKNTRYTCYIVLFLLYGIIGVTTEDKQLKEKSNISSKEITEETRELIKLKDSINKVLTEKQLNVCGIISDIELIESNAIKQADKKYPNYDYPQHGDYSEKIRTSKILDYLKSKKLAQNLYDKILVFNIDCGEADRLARIEKTKATKQNKKDQKEYFESNCLSVYDGSHRELKKLVKKGLNDSDSFEHVETTYRLNKDYAIVIMKYRGRNGFNAKILASVTAKVSNEDCSVIEIYK